MPDQLQTTDGMHTIIEALKQSNTDTIYGVVGIPVTNVTCHTQAEGTCYIGFRCEQSAGYAAVASGFPTREPGIYLTMFASEFLNGLTALANATVNGFPMIIISGSSDRTIVGLQQDDCEKLDRMNTVKPYAKAAFRVNQPQGLDITLACAIRVSVSGRPGDVYLDLPADILATTIEKDEALTTIVKVRNPSPTLPPYPKSVTSITSLLAKAERSLIILGKGAAYSQSDEQLRRFTESAQILFLPTSMTKGILGDTHPLSVAVARSPALANTDIVMLVGARLGWLLAHGKKRWAADTQFVQLNIEPQEIDNNRSITVPVVGDIASSMQGMLAELRQNVLATPLVWCDILNVHEQQDAQKMHEKLDTDTQPLNYFNTLGAMRDILHENQGIYLVNKGANALDNARNIIDMYKPRHRPDCSTQGVMGIGMGYAIGASVTSDSPAVTTEGDSAPSFSGMETEAIRRYNLPVTIVIFNNDSIYRGDSVDSSGASAPSPTDLLHHARYNKLVDAFRGVGYNITTTDELRYASITRVQSRKPTATNMVINPATGTENDHITKLNPKQVADNQILTSSPLANLLCDGREILVGNTIMLTFFIDDLLLIIVIMLSSYFGSRRETSSEDQVRAFNKLVLNYALPATLFVSITRANRKMTFVDTRLALVPLVAIVGCFFFSRFGCYKFFKRTHAEATVCALITDSPTTGFPGFAVPDPIYGGSVSTGLVVAITPIIANAVAIPIGLYLLDSLLGVDGKKNNNLSALIFTAKEPVVRAPVLTTILVLVGVKVPAAWDPTSSLIVKTNSGMAVFVTELTLAIHKFEFSVEIAHNAFLKLILVPLALPFIGVACHLNNKHLQMVILAGTLLPVFSGVIIASRFDVYIRTGTASLAMSVLGFVVAAPSQIYVSRLVS